jgi:enhancing lycopene biosynthesis protein 2
MTQYVLIDKGAAMKKNIAVILSGCGFMDGSEITEAVSTLISLDKEGATYMCFAPTMEFAAQDHLNKTFSSPRNCLEESARIARGEISDLSQLNPDQFDAIVLPGGSGAAKNLSNWAEKGAKCSVLPELERALLAFYNAGKPIGAMCIAPVVIARVLGSHGIALTIGNDKEIALEIGKTGALHEDCSVEEYVSDRAHKVLTTPAYMYDTTPACVFTGISKMIKELVEMA